MEFKSWGEIKKFKPLHTVITQKIHGTNASICIYKENEEDTEYKVRAGSRTRWIYPHDDNFGFAGWVERNKAEIIQKLGPGTHYGEYAGPGINSGEGLTKRIFALFHPGRYPLDETGNPILPVDTVIVPVLYEGPFSNKKVEEIANDLKTNGSKLVPGFMRPEGVVVNVAGSRYKYVFDAEETQWTKPSKIKNTEPKMVVDFNYLCQPIRLEKLLSRDEAYSRDYPKSLPTIVKDYVADLIKEDQITGTEDEVKSITKGASGQIFKFVKTVMEGRLP